MDTRLVLLRSSTPRGQRLSPEGKASRTLGFPVAEEHVERDFEGFQNFVVQKRYLSDVV
jgi:hypothetical protein